MTEAVQLVIGIQLAGASVFLFIASGILTLVEAYKSYKK